MDDRSASATLLYGLTGGIGSGKSTVARLFADLGFVTIDADRLGHDALAPGTETNQLVAGRFGGCVLDSGAIDRKALGRIVFSDQEKRRWLEDLMHPAIARAVRGQLAALPDPKPVSAILEGAVLLESRTTFALAGLITVWAPLPARIDRIAARDGATAAEARRRMDAQLPEHTKICYASHLVDNGRDLDWTREQVAQVAGQLAQETGGGP